MISSRAPKTRSKAWESLTVERLCVPRSRPRFPDRSNFATSPRAPAGASCHGPRLSPREPEALSQNSYSHRRCEVGAAPRRGPENGLFFGTRLIAEADADWQNATFIAGLRNLEMLHVGDSFVKLTKRRSVNLPCDCATTSDPSAGKDPPPDIT